MQQRQRVKFLQRSTPNGPTRLFPLRYPYKLVIRDWVTSKLGRKPRTKRAARKRNMTDAETIRVVNAPKRQGTHLD
jgi:hypothetical protein